MGVDLELFRGFFFFLNDNLGQHIILFVTHVIKKKVGRKAIYR